MPSSVRHASRKESSMFKRFLMLACVPAVSATAGLALTALGTTANQSVDLRQSLGPSHAGSANVNVRPLARALTVPARTSRPRTVARPAAPRPKVSTRRALPTRRPVVARALPRATTPQDRLDDAMSRIKGLKTFHVTWRLQSNDGHWGTADWYTDTIWISPRVPANRFFDVAVHEWSHLKSVHDYGGDVNAAVAAMNRYFGGSGLVGAERAADCMARLQGATWTHYTSCGQAYWRHGAARLLAGGQL
jgi:hypothetical protein